MMFGQPFDVRTLPSLIDEPRLYPDGRAAADRMDFGYRAGLVYPLRPPFDAAGLDAWLCETGPGLGERIALLAVGSNAYPRQLFDKLDGSAADAEGLLTVRVRVADVGVAYCPIRARKGYVPVTLATRPGAVASTWLQWLTPAQLEAIGATEGARYSLAGGSALAVLLTPLDPLPQPAAVYAWWFDAVLRRGDRTLWLDDLTQSAVWDRFERFDSARQLPPQSWEIVDRAGPGWATRIAQM